MALRRSTYGKGRVRVLRVERGTARHEIREFTAQVMLTGGFDAAFEQGDNRSTVATDTIKNIVNIVARENLALDNEPFALRLGERFLERYPQVERVAVTLHETKWDRLRIGGAGHDHAFTLDGNGKNTVRADIGRGATTIRSGVAGFTFLKSTASGWEDYLFDDYTTLAPTADRICATAMDAEWLWNRLPADPAATNAQVIETALAVFATTYSKGVQDSLYRMGEAVLAAIPEIDEISMACPNKHYIALNLNPFGLDNENQVFVATDEPHGQIECTVGRA